MINFLYFFIFLIFLTKKLFANENKEKIKGFKLWHYYVFNLLFISDLIS